MGGNSVSVHALKKFNFFPPLRRGWIQHFSKIQFNLDAFFEIFAGSLARAVEAVMCPKLPMQWPTQTPSSLPELRAALPHPIHSLTLPSPSLSPIHISHAGEILFPKSRPLSLPRAPDWDAFQESCISSLSARLANLNKRRKRNMRQTVRQSLQIFVRRKVLPVELNCKIDCCSHEQIC